MNVASGSIVEKLDLGNAGFGIWVFWNFQIPLRHIQFERMHKTWLSLAGLKLVSNENDTLGKMRGALMDPERGQIFAFLTSWRNAVPAQNLEGWKKTQITLTDPEAIESPFELWRVQQFGMMRCFLNGKKVLSASGKKLGRVHDFSFDTLSMQVLSFEVWKNFLAWEWGHRIFTWQDVSEVTDSAILLNIEPEATKKIPQIQLMPTA